MHRRTKILGVSLTATVAAVSAMFTFALSEPADVFCNAYGIAASPAEWVRHDGLIIIDHSWRQRDPCGDDDLWHYGDLGPVDGVLFDDCQVSWVGGGRSKAEDVGIACSS